jgi:hypothetical protein
MKGFPKFINSAEDVTNLKVTHPTDLKAYLQDILDFKDQWMMTAKLSTNAAGVTDATHKVVENKDLAGVLVDRYQYELTEDPNCRIFALGFKTSSAAQLFVDTL